LVEVPKSWEHKRWYKQWCEHVSKVEDDDNLTFLEYLQRFGCTVIEKEVWNDYDMFYKDLEVPF